MSETVSKRHEFSLSPHSRVVLHRARRHPGFLFGIVVLFLLFMAALFAPLLAPYDPYAQDLLNRLQPPIWHDSGDTLHILGTDALGRDYLSRILYGARISLFIGTVCVIVSVLIGSSLGLLAGFYGGRVDMLVMYVVTTRLSLPFMLIALALASFVKLTPFQLALLLGVLLWDRIAIVVRSAAMRVRSADFVTAARVIGANDRFLIIREILPNIGGPIIVIGSFEFAHAIIAAGSLSFLGLGVQPPLPSWGLMVSEGKKFIFFDAWLAALPGMALFITVLAVNLFGDGLRDITNSDSKHDV